MTLGADAYAAQRERELLSELYADDDACPGSESLSTSGSLSSSGTPRKSRRGPDEAKSYSEVRVSAPRV